MGRRPLASLFNYARTKRAWNLVKGYTDLQHEPFVVNHLIFIVGRLACSGNRSFRNTALKQIYSILTGSLRYKGRKTIKYFQ